MQFLMYGKKILEADVFVLRKIDSKWWQYRINCDIRMFFFLFLLSYRMTASSKMAWQCHLLPENSMMNIRRPNSVCELKKIVFFVFLCSISTDTITINQQSSFRFFLFPFWFGRNWFPLNGIHRKIRLKQTKKKE